MEAPHKTGLSRFNWRQPKSFDQKCELKNTVYDTIGLLYWQDGNVIADGPASKWIFQQTGVFRTTVTVKGFGSDKVGAIYKAGWGGSGSLQFMSGEGLKIQRRHPKPTEWNWLDAQGENLLYFSVRTDSLGKKGEITIASDIVEQPEMQLLLLLGWYLAVNDSGYGFTSPRVNDGTPGYGGPTSPPP